MFKFHYNLTRITGTSHKDRYTFVILSRSFLLSVKNISANFFFKSFSVHIVQIYIYLNYQHMHTVIKTL